ncbi:tetratricopeptide repeat-containing sensor histidine kinase [Flavobacterium frigidarium]|mgnify:CR=1 FL=1|uniref:tetratricopeptide repeat-containing sensor histidine kinase n=1 Tax=Flavobacterium frigidarium TaxID=99286 RepID=UPI0030D8EA0D
MKNILLIVLLLTLSQWAVGQKTIAKTYKNLDINAAFIADTLAIDSNIKKALSYSIQEDSLAQPLFKRSLSIAYRIQSQEQIAKVFFEMGIYFYQKFEYFDAIKCFNKAMPFFENITHKKQLAKLNYYLGQSYYYVYSEDSSFKYFSRALNQYKKDKNPVGEALCYNGIGTIYGSKNYKMGLKYLNKALAIDLKGNDNKGATSVYINIGNITSDNISFEKGLPYYQKAIAALAIEKSDYNLAIVYNNIGDCYINEKDYVQALVYFEKALEASNRMDVKILHGLIYLNIADVKLKQNNLDEAIKYSNLSLEHARKNNDMVIQANNILNFSKIYEAKKDYKKALGFKNEYISIKDRALVYEEQKKMQLFQSINELERSQLEINNLKNKNENAHLKLQSKMNLTYFLIFISIILTVFLVILVVQQKAKKRYYDLLNSKSEQVNTLKDRIQVKNDYLNELNTTKTKLFKIIGHDLRNPLSSIEAFTDLMLQKDDVYDEEDQTAFLHAIKESAMKASLILNDVLAWAINQESSLLKQRVYLHKIVDEELKLLEVLALQKQIIIENLIHERLSVITDKNKVTTIVRNLVANAIKFSHPKGKITVQAELVDTFIKISVHDNGVGIAASELQALFTADNKKSKFGTQNEKGTGLGLLLCKDFVEKLGGTLAVQSTLNVGSSFSFTLPFTDTTPE